MIGSRLGARLRGLGRARKPASAAGGALNPGRRTQDQLVTEQDIAYCYRLLLGREPDPAGLRSTRSMVGQPVLPSLVESVLQSDEFLQSELATHARWGLEHPPGSEEAHPPRAFQGDTATPTDVFFAFRLLLHREPDAEGWWSTLGEQARRKALPLDTLSKTFLSSLEFRRGPLYRELYAFDIDGEPELVALNTHRQYLRKSDYAVGRELLAGRGFEEHVGATLQALVRPGDTCVDVGANIGLFSLMMASIAGPTGRVVAIEPNPSNCRLLDLGAKENDFGHMEIIPVAVGEKPETLVFSGLIGSNGIVGKREHLGPPGPGSTLVRAETLDHLLGALSRLDVIKIDIEGAEHLALLGAQRVIAKHRPTMVLEFSPLGLHDISGVSPEEHLAFLESLGYSLARLGEGGDLHAVRDHAELIGSAGDQESAIHCDLLAFMPEALPPGLKNALR